MSNKLSEGDLKLLVYNYLAPLGFSATVSNNGDHFAVQPNTDKVGNNRKDFFDGLCLNYYNDGLIEIVEYQAGPNENNLYVYYETTNLKRALKQLLKGNKRKPLKVW